MKLRIAPAPKTQLGQEPAILETDRAGREEGCMPTSVAILDQNHLVVYSEQEKWCTEQERCR
jgi:hypothetical protein